MIGNSTMAYACPDRMVDCASFSSRKVAFPRTKLLVEVTQF